ncbi:histidine kinase [Clostridiales bacterium PH28_bin88]|nr:histidine kinase [Clostridiales bacterium PH28_bin88]
MYFKVAGIAGLLSGLQILLLLRLFALQAWQVGLTIFVINLATLVAISSWLKPRPKPKEDALLPPFDPTVMIAHETLPVLRRGLNEETAHKTAQIIQKISEVPAVAITDKERVLAYIGVGCEKHHPGDRILTEATRQVIATGLHKVVQTSQELNCTVKNCECPLAAAVIVPLKSRDEVIGSLKLYQTKDGQLPPHVIRLAIGIAQLLSIQMELAEVDRQTQLVTLAKLDALHAQINPHFLFNTLNTIIMYSRTNPQRARRLLIHLADFFRRTLKRHGHYVTLQEELECVHTYLVLEKARFGKKLHIIEDVDQSLLGYRVPVLSIQPLVENAVKHGISPKLSKGAVRIAARLEGPELVITVTDDGVGIPTDKLALVLKPGYGSGNGVGLSNVHERLKSLYHNNTGLTVISTEGKGTTISFRVPSESQERKYQELEAL